MFCILLIDSVFALRRLVKHHQIAVPINWLRVIIVNVTRSKYIEVSKFVNLAGLILNGGSLIIVDLAPRGVS